MFKKLTFILSSLILLGIIGFVLIKSQSNKVICEPATTPWKVENFLYPEEYYAGYFPNTTITQACTFRGRVTRGQLFKRIVAQNLVFCLRPMSIRHENDGWFIGITNEQDMNCESNLSSPVTLPRHGWTQNDVVGYFFLENNGAEEIHGSMEKPVSVREFNFIFSLNHYNAIASNWACWSYGMNCPSDWGNISETPRSRGIFTITNIKLGNPTSKEQIWIESMDFEVKIYLPAELPTE